MFDSSKIQPHLAFTDLREWMAEADKLGELKNRARRVMAGRNWPGDGCRGAVQTTGPAVVFDEVPGCPKGFRVIINTFAGKRRAMTFGFPQGLTKQELSDAYFEHYQKTPQNIPPVFVDNGPVFENVIQKADVDIETFPTPIWHVDDGGRYIGTGCYSVTMDPDEKWINAGCYRAMIQDKKTVSCSWCPASMATCTGKIFQQRRKMPIALVLGGDPLFFFMAGTEHPYGVCEYDVVGGMRGKPVECVRGKITGSAVSGQLRNRLRRFSE
jgi:4-hydroxy-3-polyprenylbenzoate decarboxylase